MIKILVIKMLIRILGDDGVMMALFFAQRVILGKTAFEDVPNTLKPGVYEHLLDSGVEYLAGDYTPPQP